MSINRSNVNFVLPSFNITWTYHATTQTQHEYVETKLWEKQTMLRMQNSDWEKWHKINRALEHLIRWFRRGKAVVSFKTFENQFYSKHLKNLEYVWCYERMQNSNSEEWKGRNEWKKKKKNKNKNKHQYTPVLWNTLFVDFLLGSCCIIQNFWKLVLFKTFKEEEEEKEEEKRYLGIVIIRFRDAHVYDLIWFNLIWFDLIWFDSASPYLQIQY